MPPDSPPARRVHVHVPLADYGRYEAMLRARRLSVEFYIGSHVVDKVTGDDLRRLARSMDWERTLSIHGPFMDLSPGAVDPKVAAVSLERYLQVVSFAEILKAEAVVFHSGYEKWKYAGEIGLWLDRSLSTWRAVMRRAGDAGVRVAVENIVDERPDHLRLLAGEVNHPLFGLCLDAGHREIFSGLKIEDWVDGMHPFIFELHLHDNMGVSDDHMPMGRGRIDFPALFGRLKGLSVNPVYTLEAHSPEDALASLKNLEGYV